MGSWDILEAVAIADCAVELTGEDVDDLFATAARALAELMVDPRTVTRAVERRVALTASSLDLLLYDWLSELIFLKDRERLVFPCAEVTVEPGSPSALEARLAGGPIDPERTTRRADPKAVTFHQFVLERRNGGWRARVVIDV
jgi:SHS2 domain-containing protein